MAISESRPAAGDGSGQGLRTTASGGTDPLILDRNDRAFGTTVHFTRIPTANEMRDLLIYPALAHIVIALDAWPAGYAELQTLNFVPEGPDVIVVLPGYPPSTIASDAWNLLNARLRLVLLVPGPPPTVGLVSDLNRMRHLERVIAQMKRPRRRGFERLQRPLSFRTFVN